MEEIKRLCDQLQKEAKQLQQNSYQAGHRDGFDTGYTQRKNYNDGKKLVIPFEDELFGDMLNLAVRQAVQQPDSYLRIIQFLMPLLQYLSYRTLWVMEQDISSTDTKHHTQKAKDAWQRFLIHVRVQMNHKKA